MQNAYCWFSFGNPLLVDKTLLHVTLVQTIMIWTKAKTVKFLENIQFILLLRCDCLDGYTGDGRAECTRINYCSLNPCDANAQCTDLDEDFECECNTGYSGNGLSCADIDECLNTEACVELAKCVNTPGSFSCSCLESYVGDGVNVCNRKLK